MDDDLDIAGLRARLREARGPRLWKALEEVAGTPAFRQFAEAEFPAAASVLDQAASRRGVLQAMAASFLLGGLSACDVYPPEEVIPWVEQPEAMVPGQPQFYATAVPFMGWGMPVVAECHAGRPTRLDGNDRVPGGTAALDPITQAQVLQLYDPDRSHGCLRGGESVDWAEVRPDLRAVGAAPGLALVTGQVTSPTLLRQIKDLRERAPGMRWYRHEPALGATDKAAELVFGQPVAVRWDLAQADLVVALDADPLGPGPHQVAHAEAWSRRRRAAHGPEGSLNRLFVAESTPTLTGARATDRRRVPSHRMPALLAAIANAAGLEVAVPDLSQEDWAWAGEMARLLERHGGNSLVLVGDHQPAEAQALALALNVLFANVGTTVHPLEPQAEATPDGDETDLLAALAEGRVRTLLVLDSNPAFTLPGFAEAAEAAEKVIHCGLYRDETAALADIHLPLAHALESWTDSRAVDGTVVLGQPVVRPLYGGLGRHDVLATLLGRTPATPRDEVRATWQRLDEDAWRTALHDGFVAGTAARRTTAIASVPEITLPEAPVEEGGVELVFRPDASVWDGSFANLGWLQELPQPLTKVTWDNAALISPALAERLSLSDGGLVEVTASTGAVVLPAFVLPGQAENTVTLPFGQGHRDMGRLAVGAGADVYPLRDPARPWTLQGAALRAVGGRVALADTQMHHSMEGHELVRVMSPEEARTPKEPKHHESLYPGTMQWEVPAAEDDAWAMSIDLDLCIGCNACVIACQAENNVMTVGREQTQMGREMHWIRVDRYFAGDADDPEMLFQPVPCMHCEHAPCEMGCPVNATVHGPEGLNQMIYNRCIGTRTCSSYCPYKVRRFNFFDYASPASPGQEAQMNPDVTVRARGVMEKCTYCVQRISGARRQAKVEGRPVREGEVVTACQSACPTNAIVFGNRNNPQSKVAEAKRSPRDYELLGELNLRTRTTYAARIDDSGETSGTEGEEGEG